MTNDIHVVMQSSVIDGKAERVKEILHNHVDECKEKYPDILGYEFFFDNSESELYALEWFRDSAALLKHIRFTAETFQQLSQVTQTQRVELLGNASAELVEASAAFKAKVVKHWYGFTR